MKPLKMHPARGFTVLEMVVVMGIFSIILMLLNTAMMSGMNHVNFNSAKMDLQASVRNAMTQLSFEIREASASRVTIGSGGSSLRIQIPSSVGNSGTINWSSPITYQVGGNRRQLVRTGGNEAASVLANDVQSVTFSFVDQATLAYTLTMQKTLADGRSTSVALTGHARLRNP